MADPNKPKLPKRIDPDPQFTFEELELDRCEFAEMLRSLGITPENRIKK